MRCGIQETHERYEFIREINMSCMPADVDGLHHVGHVVKDMVGALELYRRLGFVAPAPSYPAMVRGGSEPEVFGAANTHADFARNFLELASVVGPETALPAGAQVVALDAPKDALPILVERIEATSSGLQKSLERFEGLHILMFSSPDIDAAADRLTEAGVQHSGVNTVRRPAGDKIETVRYLETDGPIRIGIVAELDPDIQNTRSLDHPNGAVGLVDVTYCEDDRAVDGAKAFFETYVGKKARKIGSTWVIELGKSRLSIVSESSFAVDWPGEHAPELPALVACTVEVRDVGGNAETSAGQRDSRTGHAGRTHRRPFAFHVRYGDRLH